MALKSVKLSGKFVFSLNLNFLVRPIALLSVFLHFLNFHLGHFEKRPLWVWLKGQTWGIFFGEYIYPKETLCEVSACIEFFPTNFVPRPD